MDETTLTNFKRELEALARVRDELKLKAHLAKAEAKTQFAELERKWSLTEERFQQAKSHAKNDVALLQRELTGLVSDLKKGLQNIKRSFDDS